MIGDPLIYRRVCVGTNIRGVIYGGGPYLASRAVHSPIFFMPMRGA
jgi:hypothetical protein